VQQDPGTAEIADTLVIAVPQGGDGGKRRL
jgi:hypothetical protein